MSNVEIVRAALNAVADDRNYSEAWDAFNSIVALNERLLKDREYQHEQRRIMFAQLQKNQTEIEGLRVLLKLSMRLVHRVCRAVADFNESAIDSAIVEEEKSDE